MMERAVHGVESASHELVQLRCAVLTYAMNTRLLAARILFVAQLLT